MSFGLATCPRCEPVTPLIPTMAWSNAEFYCLECGGHFGFLSPRPAEPTRELNALYEKLHAEWIEHAGEKLRAVSGWFDWCESCKLGGEYHSAHMTASEVVEDGGAREWLRQRVTR